MYIHDHIAPDEYAKLLLFAEAVKRVSCRTLIALRGPADAGR